MDDNLYKAVVETMQDGLLVVNTCGLITAVNRSFEIMSGYSSQELVGKRCTMLNCTGCKIMGEEAGKPWCGMFVRGGVRDRRCQFKAKDGSRVDAIKAATVLRDEKGQITGAVETMKDISDLVRIEDRIRLLRSDIKAQRGGFGIQGSSDCIQRLLDLILNVAQSDAPVFIHGESGVGKELAAKAVHELGPRADNAFIKMNCASLNHNLLESELFGHVKGAFTGAGRDRMGRFEAASGGTIFLDEIGDISPSMQVKLLRVLESKEVERVGDHRPIPVDVRVITATNRDLDQLVEEGVFRADLFYRINVVPVWVPPLRERKEDIPLLTQNFIDQLASRSNKPIVSLSQEALDLMLSYDWPGNVRELRNVLEYAFVLCPGKLIESEHIAHRLHAAMGLPSQSPPDESESPEACPSGNWEQEERERLLKALRETGGNQSATGRILGVSRVTIWKKMKKFGVKRIEYEP